MRRPTFEDIPEIVKIEQQCYPNPWTSSQFADELNNPYSIQILITSEGQIAGFTFAVIICDELQINNLCVSPQFRNKGFGEKLLGQLLTRARSKKAHKAFLEVRESNLPAYNLYRKYGFHTDYKRKGFYSNGETALVMSLDL
ncbi:MAG: ribosomal protein S18-alanine N-acetyltransferase [Fibrobacter sp.]|nr:ribosomal protein S18-alanine N-acetyltransferase [Fibrobacter sp.]